MILRTATAKRKKEKLLTLAEATKYFPAIEGKRINLSTIYRWTTNGCRGVILESVPIGARRMIPIGAIRRFNEARAAQHRARWPAAGQTSRERTRAKRADDAELRAAGI